MKSEFTLKAFMPLFCIPGLIFGRANYIYFTLDRTKPSPPLNGLPLILLLTFTILWLFFGEFRTKMIKVVLNDDHLSDKAFSGLSTKTVQLDSGKHCNPYLAYSKNGNVNAKK